MLLIKPSWWARVGAGPQARRTDPGNDTPEGSGDSGVTTGAERPALTLPASPRPAATKTYRRFSSRSSAACPSHGTTTRTTAPASAASALLIQDTRPPPA